MTEATGEIRMRLDEVRHRWRRLEVLKGIVAGTIEAAGLLMVFMLADALYRFPSTVRLVLLSIGALAVLIVLGVHVGRALAKRIGDEALALFIEKRNPQLQGALLSVTEFGGTRGTPLHDYIVDVLVTEARRRIEVVDVRRSVDLGRLKKYGLLCAAMLVIFVAAGALFPQFIQKHGRRILAPWVVLPEDLAEESRRDEFFDPANPTGPIRFRVTPGDVTVLEGGAVEIVAELSRDTLGLDTTLFIRSEKSDWERIPMESVARLYTHRAMIEDVNRDLEYYVGVGNDASEHHRITVRPRLKVTGLELTTEYPSYLRRPPEKSLAYTGDIATLAGSRVTLEVKTSQRLSEGYLVMGDGSKRPLTLGETGGLIAIPIDKDDTYRYVVRNALGEEVGADRVFFIQALEDRPPMMEVMEPNNDMTVHPLSEVTCILNVTEDWALDGVNIEMEVIRQGPDQVPVRARETRNFQPAAWTGRVDAEAAELVLALEDLNPKLKPGDSIFYNFSVVDRKGQKAVSDLYFISIAEPEVFVYYGQLDWHAPDERIPISPMMQFIAAAWRLEQERAQLPPDEFLARCRQLAGKMIDPMTGKLVDFIRLGVNGDNKGPILPDSDPRKKTAADHTKAGYDLINQGEPGKAVVELKIVWAILKQFFGDASIMLAAADTQNPNQVMLEQGESFTRIEQLAEISRREMDRELQKQADQQVSWRRKLGRKEMEKVDEATKEIRDLKEKVADIADEAKEDRQTPRPQEGKDDEKKTGEEQKAEGEQKPGDDTEKKDDESRRADAERQGEGEEDKDLKDRALDAAKKAEDVARKLQEVLGEQKDDEAKRGLENLRDAAEELKRAALDFDEKELDAAERRAREAHRKLDEAEKDLGKLKADELGDMVAKALAEAHRLAERQKKLGEATDALDRAAEDVERAKKAGDRKAGAQEQLLRERRQGVSKAQEALSEQADAFKKYVERMHEAAKESDEKPAAAALEEGVQEMKRRDLPQKMVDAAVDIQQGEFKRAKGPQEDASKTIRTVVDSLYRASDALSGTKEGALARAAERAKEIKEKGLELAGLDEKDLPGTKPDEKKEEAKDDETKTKPDETPGDGKEEAELSRRRRREEAAKLWGEVRTLAGDLKSIEAVPEPAKERLGQVGEDELGRMFEEREEQRMKEFLALIARVSTILDEKLNEVQSAKKLESGLRDECPPAYRRLVGKYYSILSSEK